ncbi:hypothetical protein ACOMHN_047155 [Nucella lapillus]
MAASTEKWFCEELSKLGIDATEENAQYILSMEDAEDLHEYMLNLLDGTDPAVQAFLSCLMDRWCAFGGRPPPNATVYKKEEQPQIYIQPKTKKKRGKNKASAPQPSASALTLTAEEAWSASLDSRLDHLELNGEPPSPSSSLANGLATTQPEQKEVVQNGEFPGEVGGHGATGQGARKKSKFVPLYSQQGTEKLVIKLPGRTQCECQALKHKLVNNCMSCGRVVCEQEGAGPCLFCGNLVCSPEDQEALNRGSKKSDKLRQFLMRDADKFMPLCRGGGQRPVLPSVSSRAQEGLDKATQHKDRLLEYDKTSVRRTQVIDDECDYFSTDSNQWLNKHERDALRNREEELRADRFASRRDRKVRLDFAGRQVVEDGSAAGRAMYDHRDTVVQDVQYGRARRSGPGGQPDLDDDADADKGYLVNPTIVQPAPQFVPERSKGKKTAAGRSSVLTSDPAGVSVAARSKVGVIQDRELREMTDEGMCLSMHQPWASLLMEGIKIHEGRSWYTAHRGRLWIAATAKVPCAEEVTEMERHYRLQYQDGEVDFPADYPAGCLLGCVDMVDCLSQEDYRHKVSMPTIGSRFLSAFVASLCFRCRRFSGGPEVFPEGESACPYVFICENPQELLIKFPIKGKHKIYKLDPTMHQAAKKGLR